MPAGNVLSNRTDSQPSNRKFLLNYEVNEQEPVPSTIFQKERVQIESPVISSQVRGRENLSSLFVHSTILSSTVSLNQSGIYVINYNLYHVSIFICLLHKYDLLNSLQQIISHRKNSIICEKINNLSVYFYNFYMLKTTVYRTVTTYNLYRLIIIRKFTIVCAAIIVLYMYNR